MDTHRSLPAELTIYTASDLRTTLLGWLSEAPPEDEAWALGAAAVDQIDAAGVQLLVALSRTLESQSRQLRLRDPAPALRDACAALGLGDWLGARTAPEVAA